MAKRIQSPSSINMYKRCPRKYYLHYILKKPIKPNIHLYRGSIVHRCINKFEGLNIPYSNSIDLQHLKDKLLTIFDDGWKKNTENIRRLGLRKEEVSSFYNESILMLNNWLQHYLEEYTRGPPPKNKTELKLFSSNEYSVMGIVDVIKENGNGIEIIDYKTSKNAVFTGEYKLQLAIYALLYEENFNKLPDKVGIHFLKFKDGIRRLDVDENLINLAKRESKLIHLNTVSDNPADYPCTCGGWCARDFD